MKVSKVKLSLLVSLLTENKGLRLDKSNNDSAIGVDNMIKELGFPISRLEFERLIKRNRVSIINKIHSNLINSSKCNADQNLESNIDVPGNLEFLNDSIVKSKLTVEAREKYFELYERFGSEL